MCDEWVKVAMADDSLVVDLLLRLHRPPSPSPSPSPPPSSLLLRWTLRQPRSKPHSSARASPTTPLDAYHYHALRSKVANPSETVTTRKSRRKKTLAELKEEENLLLKERRSLKNELASLRLSVEKHRATNESLKRMKLDLESRQDSSAAATASGKAVNGPSQSVKSECHPSNSVSPKTVTDDDSTVYAPNASPKRQDIGNQDSTFVLPDLNLPVEENFSANAMHCIG
ncbi:hypothetical protein Fmac_020089 [Flemingia macrophylla]|uniref:BZIP domain-containing protein n=1 Tax=Flemingia macrophylla TaxID=520843 RepID=A0ABD1MAG0_9FABA